MTWPTVGTAIVTLRTTTLVLRGMLVAVVSPLQLSFGAAVAAAIARHLVAVGNRAD